MPYPEHFMAPMREELTGLGVRGAADAGRGGRGGRDHRHRDDRGQLGVRLRGGQGPARALRIALQHARQPDVVGTVFAGADIEATDARARSLAPYPPSSPSVALLKDGKLVYMMQRRDIETRDAALDCRALTAAFDEHCDCGSRVDAD